MRPLGQGPLTCVLRTRACGAGEQLEVIEGVNAPALNKAVNDHIPEGLIEESAMVDEAAEDEDDS